MDPNAALENARQAAEDLTLAMASGDEEMANDATDRLLAAFLALDGWMSKGGFKPMAWENIMDVL